MVTVSFVGPRTGRPACRNYGRAHLTALAQGSVLRNLLTLVLRAIAGLGIAEHRFVVSPDSLVAFASGVLQPLDVDDGDMAAAIFDEAGLLERASYERNTWPAHPHHLSHEILRQVQFISDEIAHPQQPAAHSGLDSVARIARG